MIRNSVKDKLARGEVVASMTLRLVAPAATPPDRLVKIHSDVVTHLKDGELQKKISDLGADVLGNSAQEFGGAGIRAGQ